MRSPRTSQYDRIYGSKGKGGGSDDDDGGEDDEGEDDAGTIFGQGGADKAMVC
jgi:hypothetical protein